jgi:hypothetical protein
MLTFHFYRNILLISTKSISSFNVKMAGEWSLPAGEPYKFVSFNVTSKYARALQREKKILPFIVDILYRMVHVISRRGPLSLIMALPMFTAPLLSRA